MAISNTAGKVVERRHFDPWGNVVKVTNVQGVTNSTLPEFSLLDRGYTGHEHFFKLGIIHMNGRIYDPVLRTFLSPDNFIQDPENSQNYNRYGYVLNNPLMYTDPSGKLFFTAGLAGAIITGAIIGSFTYAMVALTTWNTFSPLGLLKSTAIGAASFGVGELATSMGQGICATTQTLTQAHVNMIMLAPQALMHGFSQAFISGVTGGDFESSFVSVAVASIVSGGVNLGGNTADIGSQNKIIGTLLFGTVSDGTIHTNRR